MGRLRDDEKLRQDIWALLEWQNSYHPYALDTEADPTIDRILDAVDRHLASRPLGKSLAEAETLLRVNHQCATRAPDGTCSGCPVGDWLGVSRG